MTDADVPTISVSPAAATEVNPSLHTMTGDPGHLTSGDAASESSVTGTVDRVLPLSQGRKRRREYVFLDEKDGSEKRKRRVFRLIKSDDPRSRSGLKFQEVGDLPFGMDTTGMDPITEQDLIDITHVDPLDDEERRAWISEDTAMRGSPPTESSSQDFGGVGKWGDLTQYEFGFDELTLEPGPADGGTGIEEFLSTRGNEERRDVWWLKITRNIQYGP